MKRVLFLLALILVFSFVSCEKEHIDNDNDGKCDECGETLSQNPPACTEHNDSDSDGKCDTCGAAVENEEPDDNQETPLVLIENGTAKFKIVFDSSVGGSMRKAINNFIKDMEDEDIDIVAEEDKDSELSDVEVLVGSVTGRGEEYEIDIHTLGEKGYIVKKIGSKILVLGGSDDALGDAFDAFVEDYIGYKKNKTPENLSVTDKDNIIEIQDDYRITSVSVNSVDLKRYNIVVLGAGDGNKFADDYTEAAESLQAFLYSKAGYWLPIEDEAGEKSIVIAAVEDAGEDGFRVSVHEDALYIECAYHNAFKTSYESFIASNLSIKQGDVDFASDFSYTEEVSIVKYKDFGAAADGFTNDFSAIKAAHAYANEGGQRVVADRGTYLITTTGGDTITIMTDTDWTQAKIVIDDRNIVDSDPERGAHVFTIASSYKPEVFTPDSPGKAGETIRAINEAAKNNGGIALAYGDHPTIDLGLGYAAMLSIQDKDNRQYIRYGGNANEGYYQREIVIVDENGKGSSDTGILHDFSQITHIVVTRIDDKPVTIKGGEVTTRANQCKPTYQYFNRGFIFTRSNSVMDGLVHYITDEGNQGNPYHGFIRVQETYNVTIQNCKLSGHRVYNAMGSAAVTPQGTYDITAWDACNVTWKNIEQMNFFHLDASGRPTNVLSTVENEDGWKCWGIMSSNYCKNLTYDNCKLTRFDAHCGTYNATIKDSEVAVVAMIGGGKLEIINSTVYDTFKSVIVLRDDYGSTFAGDLILKDVKFKVTNPQATIQNNTVSLIEATFHNHYFGYKTYLPQNITIDNFVVEASTAVNNIRILVGTASTTVGLEKDTLLSGAPNKNPMELIKTITVKNNTKGYNYIHPKDANSSFNNTQLTIVDDED